MRGKARAGGRGRALQQAGVYAGIGLIGAAALVVVLPWGARLELPAELPPIAEISGSAAGCLGPSIAISQSGQFVDLRAHVGRGEARLGTGRIDPVTDEATLSGRCLGSQTSPAPVFDATITPTTGSSGWSGVLLAAGQRHDLTLEPAEPEGATSQTAPIAGEHRFARLLLAVAIIVIAARTVGWVFARMGQPRVVGEIIAGILLGPSVLGAAVPGAVAYLFAPDVIGMLEVLSHLGLILFMFLIGLELDWVLVRRSGHAAMAVSHASMVVPFTLGIAAALALYPLVGSGPFAGFALFLGAAMAITAFPVLARILTETRLHRTRVGAMAITCAAVNDLTAWCALSVVVAIVRADGLASAWRTIGLAVAFTAAMILVVKPVAARLIALGGGRDRMVAPALGAILVGLFLSSWATEAIGIHAIFGAFMAGAILPRSAALTAAVTGKLEDVTVLLLLPIFFTIVGLSTRLGQISQVSLWQIAGAVLLLAVIGKVGGSLIAARATGEGWRGSAALGVLMNTRGLTEIVILTIGRSLGVVSPALFTIMVLMALITTFMTTPLIRLIYPSRIVEREAARADAAELRARWRTASSHRVVVAVASADTARTLLGIARAMVSPSGRAPDVVLAHVALPPGREEVRASLAGLDRAAEDARRPLAGLAAELLADGIDTRVRVSVGLDPAAELVRIAAREEADLLLLGAHRPFVGVNWLGGPVGGALERAPCTGAVLLDADSTAILEGPVAFVQTGVPRDDGAAFDVASRIARGMGTSLRAVEGADHPALPQVEVDVEQIQVAAGDRAALQAALRGCRITVMGAEPGPASRVDADWLVETAGMPLLLVQGVDVTTQRSAAAERQAVR